MRDKGVEPLPPPVWVLLLVVIDAPHTGSYLLFCGFVVWQAQQLTENLGKTTVLDQRQSRHR